MLSRVLSVHKNRYTVKSNGTVYSAVLTGNLLYSANRSEDFPTVGDWVETIPLDESELIITGICPRSSLVLRKSPGHKTDTQLIAANVDSIFITMSADNNFNLNRLDRYVMLCKKSGAIPIVLLTKADLLSAEEVETLHASIHSRHPELETLCISVYSHDSLQALEQMMQPGKTYCFIGSSGVGKSTLINHLLGNDILKTREISRANSKGRHTTSHRELFELNNGSYVIDTPGMREVGLPAGELNDDMGMSSISNLIGNCRFSDCNHIDNKGCAILQAVEQGALSQSEYQNYIKLRIEEIVVNRSSYEKRQTGKKRSRMIEEVKKMKGL